MKVPAHITVKNVKVCQFASEETTCFEATIYINGKRAGTASNDGHGGCNNYHPWSVADALNAVAKTLPVEPLGITDDAGNPQTYQPDGDSIVDALVHQWQVEGDLKRALRTRILFLRDGKCMETGKLDPTRIVRALVSEHIEATRAQLKADVILNALPLPKALELYLAHAA